MPAGMRAIAGVNDSKTVECGHPRATGRHDSGACNWSVALGAASVREVERLNIYHATVLAMQRAIYRLTPMLGVDP